MSTSPQPSSAQDSGDRVDLDDLFRHTEPVGDGNGLAAPGVFETDQQLDEFLASLRADRAGDLA